MTDVNKFWDEQAREHGAEGAATAPDYHYRELEIRSVIPYLGYLGGSRVLDVGCGNGYSTVRYSKAYPSSKFTGMDISEEMIKAAPARKNVKFIVGDVLGPIEGEFDTIICTRCLINLSSWDAQKAALINMSDALRQRGELVLVENTRDGLAALNDLRRRFDLPDIQMRWHNQYLELHPLRAFLRGHYEILSEQNIGNLYYILSRVVNAKLKQQQGQEPQYTDPINEIAAQLPSLGSYGYSPNYLWHLRKRYP